MTAARQRLAVGAERHGSDIPVPLQRGNGLFGLKVPQSHRPVTAAARQRLAVGAVRHGSDI